MVIVHLLVNVLHCGKVCAAGTINTERMDEFVHSVHMRNDKYLYDKIVSSSCNMYAYVLIK